jgi:nicotinate-nucleotide adenylyltransferase
MEQELRRLGVLGGTFDPIHVGHLVAASEVLHHFDLDLVLFVPAGRPWQKEGASDPEDRFMMTNYAVAKHRGFAVSRIEIDRPGPTYTVETLEVLKLRHPDTEIFFIAGSDTVRQLDTWHRYEDLGGLAEIVSVSRPGSELQVDEQGEGWPRLHHAHMPLIDVSASEIRRRVAAGEPVDLLVPFEVAAYIRARGLYGARTAAGA